MKTAILTTVLFAMTAVAATSVAANPFYDNRPEWVQRAFEPAN